MSARMNKITAFKELNKVNSLSMIEHSPDSGDFNPNGCDVCESLACSTYAIHGYSPKYKEVLELGDACGNCIAMDANGDEENGDL